jgi:hypothetical protein
VLQVWSSEALREQFLALPLPAVRCLLASEATSVAAENTALVALAGWVEEGPSGRAATPAQRKELLSMVRALLLNILCIIIYCVVRRASELAEVLVCILRM